MYRNVPCDNADGMVTFLPAQKQQDGHNCGIFEVALAAKILDGKSSIDAALHVLQLRDHLTDLILLRK